MRPLGLFFASMFSMLAFTVPAQAAPVCGNSVVESGEDCDDGNTDPGDCCSPTCQYESTATVCRPAAHICDAAEFCDGVSDNCPIIDLPANGLPCPDGNLCNGDEICVGWVCVAGVPPDCDDEDICTADSCDQFLGCVYEPTHCNGPDIPNASPTGRLLLSLLLVGAGATFLAWRRRFGA